MIAKRIHKEPCARFLRRSGDDQNCCEVVARISEKKDYGLRARVQKTRELGVLATSFNTMLGKIQEQDRELANQLDHLARETRIPVRTLEALERGQRDGLPGPVFLRGFVQSICRCCRADPATALEILATEGRARTRDTHADAVSPMRPPLPVPGDGMAVGTHRVGQVNWTYLAILMVFVVGILVALLTVGTGNSANDLSRRPDVPSGLRDGGLLVR